MILIKTNKNIYITIFNFYIIKYNFLIKRNNKINKIQCALFMSSIIKEEENENGEHINYLLIKKWIMNIFINKIKIEDSILFY